MKRIIISGAGGFLGSHIVKAALELKDIEIVAVTSGKSEQPGVTVVNTDEFLANGYPLNNEDIFINCLFPTNADGYRMATGLEKVYRMIYMAYRSGVGAFVNISSQSVYASKRTAPAVETDALCLETPYAVGKYCSEAYTDRVFADRPHTNIRLASLLGVGYEQRIVNRMAAQALHGEPLKVVGGMQRYGFLDVRDAAAGLLQLVKSDPVKWQTVYNLGKNDSCTLSEVVQCIAGEMHKLTGKEVVCTFTEGQDERNSAIDVSRFMRDFDWCATYSLAQMVEHIIQSKL